MGFETPQEVIDYWFGNSRGTEDLDVIKQRMGLWFGRASPEFDAVQLGTTKDRFMYSFQCYCNFIHISS